MYFDLLKAFDYIERVVKSGKNRKRLILLHRCATSSEQPSCTRTMRGQFVGDLKIWRQFPIEILRNQDFLDSLQKKDKIAI